MNGVDGNAVVVTPAATTSQNPPPPFLISEQEVVFATAAATPLRPKTVHWWSEVRGVALAAMHRLFVGSTPDGRQPARHYPKRYQFLENSCMAREMDRL